MSNELHPISLTISAQTIALYAKLTADFNPLHVDSEFARTTAYGCVIAHGTLSVNLIAQALACTLGTAERSVWVDVRFLKPVKPGDTVTARGRVRDGVEYDVWVENQSGTRVIEGAAGLHTI